MLETKGQRTRNSILEVAAALATEEGLEPLSIGRLAEATAMSKSGLFTHFGSKEELQLATVETAKAQEPQPCPKCSSVMPDSCI